MRQTYCERRWFHLKLSHYQDDISHVSEPDVISVCVQPQKHYFAFRNRISELEPCNDHFLWSEYELLVDEKIVRISAINAAWMSRLPETQGQLVFPTSLFEDIIAQPCSLRIALVHHPLNWYTQSSYHDLRKLLRIHCTAILSGHEHITTVGKVSEVGVGGHLYLEADALQPHPPEEMPGFSLAIFDISGGSAEVTAFRIDNNKAVEHSTQQTSLTTLTETVAEGSALSGSFLRTLSDSGGAFIHPDRDNITLDELFVFPELRSLDVARDDHHISEPVGSDSVLLDCPSKSHAIVVSEEKGGKTSLLYTLFKKMHGQGCWPLYIPAPQVSSKRLRDVPSLLRELAKDQYANPQSFLSAPVSNRIALIDDVDQIKGAGRHLHTFLAKIDTEFGGIIATAAPGFQLQELILPAAESSLTKFCFYELAQFGHALKHRLIRKWCELVLNGEQDGTDAQILAGIDWAVSQRVDVISLSLGGLMMEPETPPTYTEAIRSCSEAGIPVVVTIDNEGEQTTGSPGNDLFALSVGATDAQDRMAAFSGGPDPDHLRERPHRSGRFAHALLQA